MIGNATMFGIGKEEVISCKVFELVFYPDGTMIREGWYDTQVSKRKSLKNGSLEIGLITSGKSCILNALASNGNAIFSIRHDESLVAASIFISSSDEKENALLFRTYLNGIRNSEVVQQLAKGCDMPFDRVESAQERPILATLLLSTDQVSIDSLLEKQRVWAPSLIQHKAESIKFFTRDTLTLTAFATMAVLIWVGCNKATLGIAAIACLIIANCHKVINRLANWVVS